MSCVAKVVRGRAPFARFTARGRDSPQNARPSAATRRGRERGRYDSRRERVRAALLSLAGWTIPGLLAGAATVLLLPIAPEAHAYLGRFAAAFLVSWWIWAADHARRARRDAPRAVRAPAGAAARDARRARDRGGARCSDVVRVGCCGSRGRRRFRAESYAATLKRLIGGHVLAGVAVYASIVAVITAIDERAARRRRELDTARLEADLAQAQLRALQMQLQPHFLFNTLHGIAMLTDTDPAGAEAMAVKLADLLRATLRLRDVPEVPLAHGARAAARLPRDRGDAVRRASGCDVRDS